MDILEDQYFKDFVETRDYKYNSLRVMKRVVKGFCEINNMTPTELIQEAREEQMSNVWISDRKVKKYLLKYLNELKNRGLKYKTLNDYISAIKTFYFEYEIQLPKIKIKNHDPKLKMETTDDIPSRDDITRALQFSDIKLGAMIKLMASSGIAHADLRNFTIGDFYNSINLPIKIPVDINELENFIKENKRFCPMIQKNRVKSGIPYTTFYTPETLRAIVDYIRNRKKPYKSADDKLFYGYDSPWSATNLERLFREVNDAAGFGWSSNNTSRFFTAHKLRKYFTSTLYANRVPQLAIEWYLGHKIPRTTNSYFKADIKTHRKEYERLLPDLTFTENVKTRIIESEEFRKLKKEYENGFKEKDEEITALKKQMAGMESILKEMLENQLNNEES